MSEQVMNEQASTPASSSSSSTPSIKPQQQNDTNQNNESLQSSPTHQLLNGTSSDSQQNVHQLSSRFAAACANTPCPSILPANLPSANEEELSFLAKNNAGDVFVSPRVVDRSLNEQDRLVFSSAIQKVLQHAVSSSLSPSETDHMLKTPPSSTKRRQHPRRDDQSESNETLSQLSLRQLLKVDDKPVTPSTSFTSFSWESSLSSSVLKNFIQNEHPSQKSPSITSPVSVSEHHIVNESTKHKINHDSSDSNNIIDDSRNSFSISSSQKPPSSSTANSNSTSSANSRLSTSTSTSSKPDTIDTVVLSAQQEAAASTVLKEIRGAHLRMRKSATGFRNGQTPVWALVAQRGGKLKPEAAAEMARARMAAATAVAVMRDAEGENDDGNDQNQHENTVTNNSSTSISSQSSTYSSSKSTPSLSSNSTGASSSSIQRGRISLPKLFDASDELEPHQDFSHEYVSPRYRNGSGRSHSSFIQRRPDRLSRPASVEIPTPKAKGIDKKSVSFVEGTIFHTKK